MPSQEAVRAPHAGEISSTLDIGLTIVIRDIGATTAAEVWLGSALVTAFCAHSRHSDSALDVAQQTVADALKPLIDAAAAARGLSSWDPTDRDNDF